MVALMLCLVAGFGMLAKNGGDGMLPGWVHPKLVIWILLGALPMYLKRNGPMVKVLWLLLPLLAFTAAAIALTPH